MAHAGKGAAMLSADRRMTHCETAHVRLVDYGLRPRYAGALAKRNIERRTDHRLRNVIGAVHGTHREDIGARYVVEHGVVPEKLSANVAAIGIQQQLVGIAAQAFFGAPRAVHAIAVALAGLAARQVAVPDAVRAGGQPVGPLQFAAPGEEAQFDRLGDRGTDGKIDAVVIRRCAERGRAAGLHEFTSTSRRPGLWVRGARCRRCNHASCGPSRIGPTRPC